MAKRKNKNRGNNGGDTATQTSEKVDLSKVEVPEEGSLSNKVLLDTIQGLVAQRAKENPKHPHVGVNEIATFLSEEKGMSVDGKDIRRQLQRIRKKSSDYKGGKTGTVNLAPDASTNPYDAPITIQWVNRNDRQKGIEYLVTQ